MPDPTLAYIAGVLVGLFIGVIAYAFLSSTSPEDGDEETGTAHADADADADAGDDTESGVGPFALCAGCGRIAPRDEQMRLCSQCAPPPEDIDDPVTETER